MPRQYRSLEDVQRDKEANETFSFPSIGAQIEEMGVLEHFAVPEEKTLKQREKYFKGIKFRNLEEGLRDAQKLDFV